MPPAQRGALLAQVGFDPNDQIEPYGTYRALTPTYSGQFFKDVLAGTDIDLAGTPALDGAAADAPNAASGEPGPG